MNTNENNLIIQQKKEGDGFKSMIANIVTFLILAFASFIMIGNYGSLSAMPYLFVGWLSFILIGITIFIVEIKRNNNKLLVLLIAIQLLVTVIMSSMAVLFFD